MFQKQGNRISDSFLKKKPQTKTNLNNIAIFAIFFLSATIVINFTYSPQHSQVNVSLF